MKKTATARIAELEEQVTRLTRLVEGAASAAVPAPVDVVKANGHAPVTKRSRRDLLRLAGAAAAGAAGVALAETRGVTNAYAATTDTNFIANGTVAIGFDSTPGHFATGVYGLGSNNGVLGQGANAGGFFLPGARGNLILPPAGSAGPPAGNHFTGDLVLDVNGVIFVCTKGDGSGPGTFAPLQQGGINNAIFTAVTNQQYFLTASDGVTWMEIDPANFTLTINPNFNARGLLFANADLWTSTAGFNQDLGIFVQAGAGADQLHSWKESGGFAGTFSPNAAFVHGVFGDFFKGTTYTVRLKWKTNRDARPANATIYAAAGGAGAYSSTRLSVQLIAI